MGVTIPGCFADCVAAPAEFVWPLPGEISDLDAATIEPLTVALHALLQSGVTIGDTIAVVGCGMIGLLLIHAAVRQGVRVLAHDKLSAKLESARRLGAIAATGADLNELWEAENVTAVFECAGVSAAAELSIRNAPRGSRVVLLGLASSPASFVPLDLVRRGVSIEPSLIYDHPADFARSISLVANGTLQPSIIVSDTFPFDSIGQALELASNGGAGKIHTIIG
jgi:threonine dehydrogenase-like Zn-dependent dehydrogenase